MSSGRCQQSASADPASTSPHRNRGAEAISSPAATSQLYDRIRTCNLWLRGPAIHFRKRKSVKTSARGQGSGALWQPVEKNACHHIVQPSSLPIRDGRDGTGQTNSATAGMHGGSPTISGPRLLSQAESTVGWSQFRSRVESLCEPHYAKDRGRRSIPPGVYFRMLLIGFFEGIGSQRGIGWRCSDSLVACVSFWGCRRPILHRIIRA